MLRETYRRYLPHIMPIGACFFVTFRLTGSLSKEILDQMAEKRSAAFELILLQKELAEIEKEQQFYAVDRQYWIAFNDALDTNQDGEHHLRTPELAQIVANRLQEFDGKYYKLCAYVVMSNHVHTLLDFSIQLPSDGKTVANDNNYKQLDKVMQLIKGGSSKYCNDWLRQHKSISLVPFWVEESYDRYIRNTKHFDNTVDYIKNNPVKIGLCSDWREYPFCYVAPNLYHGL
jgi:putative transposase